MGICYVVGDMVGTDRARGVYTQKLLAFYCYTVTTLWLVWLKCVTVKKSCYNKSSTVAL